MTLAPSQNSLYKRALQLIHQQACAGVGIKSILAGVPVSRSTLDRHFKQHLGHTPAHELMLVRLAKAKELLSTTQLPMKQIARLVGCRDVANFYRFFRRQTGMAPGEFRMGAAW